MALGDYFRRDGGYYKWSDASGPYSFDGVSTFTLMGLGGAIDTNGNQKVVIYDTTDAAIQYDPIIDIKGDFRPTFAVRATPDYADGECVGGLITLTDFAKSEGGSGTLTRFCFESTINITVDTYLHIFVANPSASTFTDSSGTALVLHVNDKLKKIKTIKLLSTDWRAPIGVDAVYTVEAIAPAAGRDVIPYTVTTGRDLYAAWETNGTINFGATTNVNIIVGAENV